MSEEEIMTPTHLRCHGSHAACGGRPRAAPAVLHGSPASECVRLVAPEPGPVQNQPHFTAAAPAAATSWSCSTVEPETPMAPMIVPSADLSGTPPGKVIRPSL